MSTSQTRKKSVQRANMPTTALWRGLAAAVARFEASSVSSSAPNPQARRRAPVSETNLREERKIPQVGSEALIDKGV